MDGLFVGDIVGFTEGTEVVGAEEGADGNDDGFEEGGAEGVVVGGLDGANGGSVVGLEGKAVGAIDGELEGAIDGFELGDVGETVGGFVYPWSARNREV